MVIIQKKIATFGSTSYVVGNLFKFSILWLFTLWKNNNIYFKFGLKNSSFNLFFFKMLLPFKLAKIGHKKTY